MPPASPVPRVVATRTPPGDFSRRSAVKNRPPGRSAERPSYVECPTACIRGATHDDRDESGGDGGRDPVRHRADRSGGRPCPSLARRGGDRDRRDRGHRAHRSPRARGRARRRPCHADPQALQARLEPAADRRAHGRRGRRPHDRRRALLDDRRAVHGRVARPAADDGAHRARRRRLAAARRRLQAAHLALRLPGPRPGGPAAARRGQGRDRAADRHRADGRARPRARARGGRRHPGRRPQHAELPAAGRDRPLRAPGAAQARARPRRSRSC